MLGPRRRIAGWVGTLADVTAEAGAEAAMADARDEATEASRLKSDFLANMSHEIRTPMNGVIGMTDLLLETELDAGQRDFAETVRNSGEALLTIINDILDFSKIEAGSWSSRTSSSTCAAVVDDVVDLLAGPAQAKGLELIAVVERSVPAVVRGDPGRVRQVLTNLVGNAIKFTQAGRDRRPGHARPAPPGSDARRSASRSPTPASASRPTSSACLPAVRPGRHVHLPEVRRHRPRPGDQQPARRADGRRLRRRQRARHGQHVLVHRPACGRRRRGNVETPVILTQTSPASASWSSTTTPPNATSCPTTSPAGG